MILIVEDYADTGVAMRTLFKLMGYPAHWVIDGPEALVHTRLTMRNGIFNLELMNFAALEKESTYRFMFVFTPLRLKGATGSPGRPVAIF